MLKPVSSLITLYHQTSNSNPTFIDRAVLSSVSGDDLTEAQIAGILAQIDLDLHNLLRGGKLSALKYTEGGAAGRSADRADNLRALLEARRFYTTLQQSLPGWHVNQYEDPHGDD